MSLLRLDMNQYAASINKIPCATETLAKQLQRILKPWGAVWYCFVFSAGMHFQVEQIFHLTISVLFLVSVWSGAGLFLRHFHDFRVVGELPHQIKQALLMFVLWNMRSFDDYEK